MRKAILSAALLIAASKPVLAQTLSDAQFAQILQAVRDNGSHHPLEMAYWISQVVLAVIASLAAIFAYSQVRTLKLFEILKYIHSSDLIKKRRKIREAATQGPIKSSNSSSDLQGDAWDVYSSYDVLGRVLSYSRVGRYLPGYGLSGFFIRGWGRSAAYMHTAISPLIDEQRNPDLDPSRSEWEGYKWLYANIPQRLKDEAKRASMKASPEGTGGGSAENGVPPN